VENILDAAMDQGINLSGRQKSSNVDVVQNFKKGI
jgi:hypothetical protein